MSIHSTFELECCYPRCSARVTEQVRQPLCDAHLISVYRDVRDRIVDSTTDERLAVLASPRPHINPPRPSNTGGEVYFVHFGDRIKIGYTANFKQRMKVIPHDQVLATIPGTPSTEKRLHRRFDHLRITGEWFRADGELLRFIADLELSGQTT